MVRVFIVRLYEILHLLMSCDRIIDIIIRIVQVNSTFSFKGSFRKLLFEIQTTLSGDNPLVYWYVVEDSKNYCNLYGR